MEFELDFINNVLVLNTIEVDEANTENVTINTVMKQPFKPVDAESGKREWEDRDDAVSYWNTKLSHQFDALIGNNEITIVGE